MKSVYLGSRGYQAPEVLLDKPYDLSCDIFSIGVVLFILMTGYRPFEQALSTDRWYKSMTKKKYELFWKAHRASPLANNKRAKDLIQKMLSYDPKERISISDIKKHEWYNGKYLEGKDLIRALRNRYREMESKRQKDARLKQMKVKMPKHRFVIFEEGEMPPLVGDDINERINCLHTITDWKDVFNLLHVAIGMLGGTTEFNEKTLTLHCTMVIANQSKLEQEHNYNKFEFTIEIFLSLLYNDERVFNTIKEAKEYSKNMLRTDSTISRSESQRKEILLERQSVQPCYVVKIKRISGDGLLFFNKIKRGFILSQLGWLFTPVHESRKKNFKIDTDDEFLTDSDYDDDYHEFLKENDVKQDN